jgi:hypothetical protein
MRVCDDSQTDRPTKRYIQEKLRSRGLIGRDEFICIAQDIPPYTELPVTD